MGEKLTEDERKLFKALTQRDREPGKRIEEMAAVVGRRGGKYLVPSSDYRYRRWHHYPTQLLASRNKFSLREVYEETYASLYLAIASAR